MNTVIASLIAELMPSWRPQDGGDPPAPAPTGEPGKKDQPQPDDEESDLIPPIDPKQRRPVIPVPPVR